MKLQFWLCASVILFTYAGYPICLYFRARFWPRPIHRASILPRVTMILVVHNEGKYLPGKLANLAGLDYPVNRLETIVISDGSTDETNRIASEWQLFGYRAVILPEHRGKANALNLGMAEAKGEIVCFTDARQKIAADGLKNLVANFADPSVGCASGELILREDTKTASSDAVGLYWRLEKQIRNWEGLAGSTVGTTGAFYAVRKDLLSPLPEETVLDDVYIPLQVARQGRRVVFDMTALAWDDLAPSPKQEFRRKLRTLTGNYQLLQLAPWLLTSSNPLRIQFICHKLLRLMVPFALVGIFVSSLWLRAGAYEAALILQLMFYALAGLRVSGSKFGVLSRLSNVALTFIVLNTAAAVALLYFVTGRKAVWTKG